MAARAEFTVKELREEIARGRVAKPVFGMTVGQKPVEYSPRNKFDPQPWTDGFFRWHTWELTTEDPEPSPELLAQAHALADHDATDQAFARLVSPRKAVA